MACSCASPRDPTARHFDERWARRELAAYRRGGPGRTTRRLLDGLRATNTGLGTVLDIGAGIGILTLGLLQAGARLAVCVDFSAASMAVGAEEARRLGVGDRIEWLEGDFTAIAPSVPPADVVTLDRVV
jgi:predicted RNA methylase